MLSLTNRLQRYNFLLNYASIFVEKMHFLCNIFIYDMLFLIKTGAERVSMRRGLLVLSDESEKKNIKSRQYAVRVVGFKNRAKAVIAVAGM